MKHQVLLSRKRTA